MKEKILDEKAAYILIVFFLTGSFFVFSEVSKFNNDIWICIILANIVLIPLCLLYTYILSTFSEKNFFGIIEILFGKLFGKCLIFAYIIYSGLVCMLNINAISDYLKYNDLKETPKLFIALLIIFICIKAIRYGIDVLGNFCKLIYPLMWLTLIVPTLLSYKIFDFYNLIPILSNDYNEILSNTLYFFTIPLGEIVLYLVVFSYIKNQLKNSEKNIDNINFKKLILRIFLKGISICFIVTLIIYLRNILVLGQNVLRIINYPTYYSTAIIYIAEFFQRFEIFISIIYILTAFVKITICLLFTVLGIKHLFNFNNHIPFTFSIAFITTSLSTLIFRTHSNVRSVLLFYPNIALIFQIVIPVIMGLSIYINQIKENKKQKQ